MGALLLLGSVPLFHLMAVPAFEDEGSQLRWIWRIIEAGEWLQPLGDGKPLEAWPMVPLVRLSHQPLAAIRAVHVLVGMIGAVLTYRLALQVSDRMTAFACGILFATCPFVVYLQRFALSDILMCTAGVWVLLSAANAWRRVPAPKRGEAIRLMARNCAAQRRAGQLGVSGKRQDQARGRRRSAGNDRYRRFRARPVPHAVRQHHAFGTAAAPHVRAMASARRDRHDISV